MQEANALTRSQVEQELQVAKGRFYVYILLRPNGTPFYVGKGKGRRVFHHEREAMGPGLTHKLNIIRSITKSGRDVGYRILEFFETEEACFAREIEEIARIGRHDLGTGPLANLTAGGEGTSGLTEETKRRIDAELHGPDAPGERGIANRFFLKLCCEVRSVPIRPASEFNPVSTTPHRNARKATPRMAAALVASAIANRVLLQPGCVIPRCLDVNGTKLYIENGASLDILRAGLGKLQPAALPAEEGFVLDGAALEALISLSNVDLLLDAGVLEPESS